jgi:phosphatidylinositol glycan class V
LVIHHAVMTFLLIFQSHTQIALRVCSTDPVFWWMLTDIAYKKDGVWLDHVDAEQWIYRPDHRGLTKAGERWIWWSVVWGAISIVLWAGFYPPA